MSRIQSSLQRITNKCLCITYLRCQPGTAFHCLLKMSYWMWLVQNLALLRVKLPSFCSVASLLPGWLQITDDKPIILKTTERIKVWFQTIPSQYIHTYLSDLGSTQSVWGSSGEGRPGKVLLPWSSSWCCLSLCGLYATWMGSETSSNLWTSVKSPLTVFTECPSPFYSVGTKFNLKLPVSN